MTITDYLDKINTRYKTGISREHTYRGDLQNLLEHLCPDLHITNEPARIECGSPDYVLTKRNIPVGYIEAKDIDDADLEGKKNHKEQFERYKSSLPNLIFTDYLRFHFYVDGEMVEAVELATIVDNKLHPNPAEFDRFTALIKDFSTRVSQTIRSAAKLSKMMAGKARLLANVIENAIVIDEKASGAHEAANNTLREQMAAFKEILIHDITPKAFADIYAQTIAYGMFAARLHDETLEDFSRHEAAGLIPKSNPFLRKLFQYISGYDIDDRIVWIVDALADIFRATDVRGILKDFGKATAQTDPMIHFYETFLAEYDPKLRKSRGVWYTPEPVVNFIVRAVDDILKTEFGLKDGLADTSKTKIKVNTQMPDKRSSTGYRQEEREVHKVQILDPATGTGTFLAEIVKQIYSTRFKSMQGVWSKYVEDHLIPRLNGFEILMASYAMAHLKLDMLLGETGYSPTRDQRLRIYLTNSLEEHHPDTGTLFANWLSSEANEANHVKRDTPVMVVLGNPPYSGDSVNKGDWIMRLMDDYKTEPGGQERLKERNPKIVTADEHKFIRYAQYFIEKNEVGLLAYINPHTFIESQMCRGMRWHLLNSFDKTYILDLHGNSTKKETAPDGSIDENVFDILQGVSINIFIKTGKKKNGALGEVHHAEIYGRRAQKYDFLMSNSIATIPYQKLNPTNPYYYFEAKNLTGHNQYVNGFEVTKLLKFTSSGIKTHDDKHLVADSYANLESNIELLDIEYDQSKVYSYMYRPFDLQLIYYDARLIGRAREKTIYHLKNQNIALILVPKPEAANLNYFDSLFVTNCLTDTNMYRRGGPKCFMLYLYPDKDIEGNIDRIPNLNKEIVNTIANDLGLTFTPEKLNESEVCFTDSPELRPEYRTTFAPIDLLDYIYAVLHSPTYREKYKEFLKIDFPRVPYPTDKEKFWQLVKLGGELRQIHLLESPKVEVFITSYPADGDNIVTRSMTKRSPGFELTDETNQTGRVWINDEQYFEGVPLTAWEFYIGGYQPAQKWLKDRKGRELSFDDILHYQKIIVALTETARLMEEVDVVGVED